MEANGEVMVALVAVPPLSGECNSMQAIDLASGEDKGLRERYAPLYLPGSRPITRHPGRVYHTKDRLTCGCLTTGTCALALVIQKRELERNDGQPSLALTDFFPLN